ncbi:hypothetical protein D3C77_476410 [compost metagenome]
MNDRHRLVDFTCQPGNIALLGLHQAAPADRLLIDAVGAVDRRCSTARHFLCGGRHLVHGRGHLLDLPALAADRLVAACRHRMHLLGLALDFDHGVADLLDQVMNTLHGAVEHLPQLPQFVTTAGPETHRHVACGHLVHHRTE